MHGDELPGNFPVVGFFGEIARVQPPFICEWMVARHRSRAVPEASLGVKPIQCVPGSQSAFAAVTRAGKSLIRISCRASRHHPYPRRGPTFGAANSAVKVTPVQPAKRGDPRYPAQ
jgi:hypothetical protein